LKHALGRKHGQTTTRMCPPAFENMRRRLKRKIKKYLGKQIRIRA
jgi:hypothetical protein